MATVGRASLVDVARLLHVSPATVSRAFNHPTMLRHDTVERVQAAAAEIGYVPNRHAQALITGRTGAIGLLVPDITNPFFPKLVRHAQRIAQLHGLSMMIAESNLDPDNERHQLATMAPQTEGVLLASSRLPDEELRHHAAQTHLVLVNNDTDGVPRVLISAREALTQGLTHLADHGAHRIAYIGGPRLSWAERERRTTVERTAARLQLTASYLRTESGTYREALAMAARVADAQPDAVIAYDDIIAHGVMIGLQRRGIRVPDDVSILGCDDALPIQTSPNVSTIHLNFEEAARDATELLLQRPAPTPAPRIETMGRLTLRETTP